MRSWNQSVFFRKIFEGTLWTFLINKVMFGYNVTNENTMCLSLRSRKPVECMSFHMKQWQCQLFEILKFHFVYIHVGPQHVRYKQNKDSAAKTTQAAFQQLIHFQNCYHLHREEINRLLRRITATTYSEIDGEAQRDERKRGIEKMYHESV